MHGLYEAVKSEKKKKEEKKRIKRDGLKLLAWVIIGEGEKKGAIKTDGLKTIRVDNTVASKIDQKRKAA